MLFSVIDKVKSDGAERENICPPERREKREGIIAFHDKGTGEHERQK